MDTTLRIHAVAAPAFAAIVSFVYFKHFGLTTPLGTAAFFTLFIVLMDALVVAPLFEKSYAMFSSPLGTWVPLLSIFAATYSWESGSAVLGAKSSCPIDCAPTGCRRSWIGAPAAGLGRTNCYCMPLSVSVFRNATSASTSRSLSRGGWPGLRS